MLKYKRYKFSTIAKATEELTDMLAGMAGKNRRVVSLACSHTIDMSIRVYRDAEQFVDVISITLTDEAPFMPMDIPLAEGQLCKVGFHNGSAETMYNQHILIGYTED